MIGRIAQLLTVLSYGNEYLNNGAEKLDLQNHLSFRGTGDAVYKDTLNEDVGIIGGTNEWFAYLNQNGCKKIRLFYDLLDHEKELLSLSLIDNLVWVLETVFDRFSDYWVNEWRYGSNGWWVRTKRTASAQPIIDKQGDLIFVKKELENKLTALCEFAKAIEWDDWFKVFNKMKSNLYNDNPFLPEYHKDLIVEKNYSLLAKQVLYTAESSWCFTGMGSWSDICLFTKEDRDRKEELTKELFYTVCDAYVLSINSY